MLMPRTIGYLAAGRRNKGIFRNSLPFPVYFDIVPTSIMVQGGEVSATDSFEQTPLVDRASLRPANAALDIVVRWGDWVLAAHELTPVRPFFVGEQNADVVLPVEIVGVPRLPVVLVRWDGAVRVVVPSNARLMLGGQTKRRTAARLIARGLAQPSSSLRDAAEVPMLPGQTATLLFGPVAIDLHLTTAAETFARQPVVEKRVLWAQFASFVLHAVLLGVLLFVIGPPEVDLVYGMTEDQLNTLQRALWRLERRESQWRWEHDEFIPMAQRYQPRDAAERNVWMDSLGAASDRWSAELAAEAERAEKPVTSDSSLIGVLYDWPAPPPPPKRRPTIAEVMKMPVTTLPEERGGRRAFIPMVRMGATSVSGRLPPEVIQRIVRQNFGRFRLCYENGLRNNPNLMGRVSVRFVIGRDGMTSNVGNGGSDLPDMRVIQCVMRQFMNLEYPQPEGGIVTVVFPIMFSPPG